MSEPNPKDIADPVASFVGGFYCRSRHAPAVLGMVRLDLFDDRLRIGPTSIFAKILVPTWEARYDELRPVEIASRGLRRGFRFRRKDRGSFLFTTQYGFEPVVGALRRVGAPIAE